MFHCSKMILLLGMISVLHSGFDDNDFWRESEVVFQSMLTAQIGQPYFESNEIKKHAASTVFTTLRLYPFEVKS